jgi:hypothetical protein
MSFKDFLSKFFGRSETFLLPASSSEIGPYEEDFERAIRFTKSCGFKEAPVSWLGKDFLKEDNFLEAVVNLSKVDDFSKSACQCLKWCHYFVPYFESHFGCRVMVTIGQLWHEEDKVYSPTWDELKRWCAEGFRPDNYREGRTGFNLHSWLTLESGEIIDLTFFSTLAKIYPDLYGKVRGGVVFGREPNVIPKYRYFPMAVGQNFVQAIADKTDIQVLANNPSELEVISAGYYVMQ